MSDLGRLPPVNVNQPERVGRTWADAAVEMIRHPALSLFLGVSGIVLGLWCHLGHHMLVIEPSAAAASSTALVAPMVLSDNGLATFSFRNGGVELYSIDTLGHCKAGSVPCPPSALLPVQVH